MPVLDSTVPAAVVVPVRKQALAADARLDWELRTASALVDLVGRIGSAATLRLACQDLVEALARHMGCPQAAVALRPAPGKACRLLAVADMPKIDARAEMSQALEAALNESLLVGQPILAAARDDGAAGQHPAHRRLATLAGRAVRSQPLTTRDGQQLGAWLVLGPQRVLATEAAQRFLASGAQPVGTALAAQRRAEPGPLRRLLRAAIGPRHALRRKVTWIAVAVVAAAMFLPVPYKISAECELQPVVRRFVAAPYTGVFEKSLIKPGDTVAADQVLGRMEGREINIELASVAAETERSAKSHDVNMAAGKVAATQIDQLETERLALKQTLLDRRREHLHIKSPLAGIVISGDLQRSEGVPVTVGQVLYEVAPLEALVAELAIPDDSVAAVAAGRDVSVWLDAYPGTTWTGPLGRINPRSVVREHDNVFIGELRLENQGSLLRPGMKGHARIAAGSRPLGWVLLHKPWHWALAWLGC